MSSFFAGLLLCAALVCSGYATTKRWKGPTLLWQNASNWHGGQLPCSADFVSFDETWAPSAVFIQQSVSVHELMLPMNGDLVLGDINITISDDTSCSGKFGRQLTYLSPAPGDWDNPMNWESVDGSGNVLDNTKSPPSDRLPCSTDTVVFPPNSSVAVKIGRRVQVGSLVVNNALYNTPDAAKAYFQSHVGMSQFRQVALNALSVSGTQCGLGAICTCGNSNRAARRSSCSYSTPSCPAVIDCLNPVMLADDCCATCGVVFNITVPASFRFDSFRTAVKSKLQSYNYRLHIASPTMVQLIVVGTRAQDLSDVLYNQLRSPTFSLTSSTPISVDKSSPHPTSPPPTTTPRPTTQPTTTQPTTQPTTKPTTQTTMGQITTEYVAPSTGGQGPIDIVTRRPGTIPGEGEGTTREQLVTLCATLGGVVSAGQGSGSGSSNTSSTDKEGWYVLAALAGIFLLFAILVIFYLVTRQKPYGRTPQLKSHPQDLDNQSLDFSSSQTVLFSRQGRSLDEGYIRTGRHSMGGMSNPLYSAEQ